MKEIQLEDFEQKDAVNCGLYTIEFVDHYIHDTLPSFRVSDDEPERVQHTRLMYLNMLISNCSRTPPPSIYETTVDIKEDVDTGKKIHKRGSRGPRKPKRGEGSAKKPQKVYSTASESEPIPRRILTIPESEHSSSSAPPSPRTAETIAPYPKYKGTMMTEKNMRHELAQFIHKYRRQSVDIRLATAYFTNHIDKTNRKRFIKLFNELAGKDGDDSGQKCTEDDDQKANNNAAKSKKDSDGGVGGDYKKSVKRGTAAGSSGGGSGQGGGGGSGGDGSGDRGGNGDDSSNDSDNELETMMKFKLNEFIRKTLSDTSTGVPSTSALHQLAEKKLNKTISWKLFNEVYQAVRKDVMASSVTRAKLKSFIKQRESNLPPKTADLRKDAEKEFGVKISKKLFRDILKEWDEEHKADLASKKRKADTQGGSVKLLPCKKAKVASSAGKPSYDEAGSKSSKVGSKTKKTSRSKTTI
jgi:hypothetical protein